jgi:hypothetical protein
MQIDGLSASCRLGVGYLNLFFDCLTGFLHHKLFYVPQRNEGADSWVGPPSKKKATTTRPCLFFLPVTKTTVFRKTQFAKLMSGGCAVQNTEHDRECMLCLLPTK